MRRSGSCAPLRSKIKKRSSTNSPRAAIPASRAVLTAFLEDRLYFRNNDQKIFIAKPGAEDAPTLSLIDPLTLKSAGSASADDLSRIVANNHLRRILQTTLARYGLSSPDASIRLASVQDIEKDLDEANVQMLRQRLAVETNSRVKKEIATGLALVDVDSQDAQTRLAAISALRGSLRQDVLNKLQGLIEKSPDGSFAEQNEQVRQAAAAAVKSITRSAHVLFRDRNAFLRVEPRDPCSC